MKYAGGECTEGEEDAKEQDDYSEDTAADSCSLFTLITSITKEVGLAGPVSAGGLLLAEHMALTFYMFFFLCTSAVQRWCKPAPPPQEAAGMSEPVSRLVPEGQARGK